VDERLQIFLMSVAMYISGELKVDIDWRELVLKKCPWDDRRYILSIEFSNVAALPLRVRIYFVTVGNVTTIGHLVITEDTNHSTGPEDELYVGHGVIDKHAYNAVIGYFEEAIDPDEYIYYDVILDDDLNVILANDGSAILYT